MSALLDQAFGPTAPADALPSGPLVNDWGRLGATPVAQVARESTLLHELWGTRGHHHTEDGRLTSVPRRAVPSAGGTYPVQWHLVVPAAAGSVLAPGRYVLDGASTLLRRPGPDPHGRMVTLVISVQPGRTYGRYRHRAWPLWVADAAYALEGVRALVTSARLPRGWDDLADARALAGVASASHTDWWLEQGLAPEICLARVELPDGWRIDRQRVTGLRHRRSPTLGDFEMAAARTPVPGAREVADQSGQAWVLGADRVMVWPRPRRTTTRDGYVGLWDAHRRAAALCYRLACRGVSSRPVSGFPRPSRTGADPLLHALAVLDPQKGTP